MASSSSSLLLSPSITSPLLLQPWSRGPLICICPCSIQKPRAISRRISAVAAAAPQPWLMLPTTFEGGRTVYNFYNLKEKKAVEFSNREVMRMEICTEVHVNMNHMMGLGGGDADTEVVGSSHGFLALFHKRNHRLFLFNPISRRSIDLPSVHANLSLSDIGLGPLDMRVTKLITSRDNSRAVMIFGPANRLAFCCPGRSNEWTPLGALFFTKPKYHLIKHGRIHEDVVYSDSYKLFTSYTEHDIETWNLRFSRAGKQLSVSHSMHFNKHDVPWWHGVKDAAMKQCNKESYLVEHSSQLYLVYRYIMERSVYTANKFPVPVRDWDDRYPYKTIGFSVYKVARVGVNTLQLNYMEGSLDNLVMFLGRNHSFALPAEDYPELRPDSIYFTDNPRHTPLDWQTYGAHDTAIYYFNERTFYPFDYPNYHDIVSTIKGTVSPPLWFTPSRY